MIYLLGGAKQRKKQINLIFDLLVPHEYDQREQDQVQLAILDKMQQIDSRYQCVITVDKSFVSLE